MNESINFKRTMTLGFDAAVDGVTNALKGAGFGVLTRIDLHSKIKEKIGKDIPKTTILGACNPSLAYEAYMANPDVTSLLPCNAVVRDVSNGNVSIEVTKPSALMKMMNDKRLEQLAMQADEQLEQALRRV